MTHCFQGRGDGILDNGSVLPEALAARENGEVFDVGRRIKPERVMKGGRWIDPASCSDSLRPLAPCDHEVLGGLFETA